MTDPKVFTGPEGYTFQIEGENVFVGRLSGPRPAGVIVPLAELDAFIAWRDRQARADARREAYVSSTAEVTIDAEGRDFPPGTRVLSVDHGREPASVVFYPGGRFDFATPDTFPVPRDGRRVPVFAGSDGATVYVSPGEGRTEIGEAFAFEPGRVSVTIAGPDRWVGNERARQAIARDAALEPKQPERHCPHHGGTALSRDCDECCSGYP